MPTQPPKSSRSPSRSSKPKLTYAHAGVDLQAKDSFTESLGKLMRRTYGPRVIDNPGGFAGLFRLDFNEKIFARNYKNPVLVACADGVGTKLKLAIELKTYNTLGIDLVAMNVNDMIVQGAEPLFFLDYIATPKVDKSILTDLVKGITDGCVESGCALLGGETAEMPDLYAKDDFDLAGFAVGVVDLSRAIDPGRVEVGDIVLGLASSGVHSNGYSLVRKIVAAAKLNLNATYPELNQPQPETQPKKRARSTSANKTLGQHLLTPTKIYVNPILSLLRQYKVKKVIGGMANITGSGIEGNLCRALHPNVDALIDSASWPMPPLFEFLMDKGNVDRDEMFRVFNMGIGFTLIVRPTFANAVKDFLTKQGQTVYTIGIVTKGKGNVIVK